VATALDTGDVCIEAVPVALNDRALVCSMRSLYFESQKSADDFDKLKRPDELREVRSCVIVFRPGRQHVGGVP
jgi:hypothetical protein